VYGEDELRDIFAGAPVVPSAPTGLDASGTLCLFVADELGTTIYGIADPRTSK
jgi:hypothetical protein